MPELPVCYRIPGSVIRFCKAVFLFIIYCNALCVHAQMPEVVLPLSHSAPIYKTRFIQDGKYMITFAYDNTAKLWDVYSGRLLHSFKDLDHSPRHVEEEGNTSFISADERSLVALTIDGFIKKWELPSANLGWSKNVVGAAVAVSYAGGHVLVESRVQDMIRVELIDVRSGKILFLKRLIPSDDPELPEAILSPAGKLVSILENNRLTVYTLPAGKNLSEFSLPDDVVDLGFSNTGKYFFYTRKSNNLLYLLNVNTNQSSSILVPGYFEFAADDSRILSKTNKLLVIDPETGEEQLLNEYDKPSMFAHFNEDGKFIYLSRTNGFIRGTEPYDSITKVWETLSGKLIAELKMSAGDISQVVFSPDHRYIATTAGSTDLWDAAGSLIRSFQSRQVVFDNQSRYIAVTGDKEVSVYSLQSGQLISELKGSSKRLVNASLSSNGRMLATLTNENHVKLWNLGFGKIERTVSSSSMIQSAQLIKNQPGLLITAADSVHYIDINDGHRIYSLDQKVNSARLSDNGEFFVVTSGMQGSVKETVSGKPLFSFSENYKINDAGMSSNGRFAWYIFGGSAAGLADLSNSKIYRYYLGEEDISHCEISPDEKYFFIKGERATAKIYLTASGEIYRTLSEKSQTEYAVSSLFPEGFYLPVSWQGENRVFSSDGRSILFRSYMDRYIVLRHLDNIDKSDTIFTRNQLVRQAAIIPNSPYIITVTTDDTIRLWQKKTGAFRTIKSIPGNGFKITPDGKITVLVNDSQLSLLETKSLNVLVKTIGMNENDFFTQPGNEPYYMATKKAVSQLTFRYNGNYYSYEQFDLKFNRPDKVLSGIGFSDKNLVASYRKAYEKRMKRLGLTGGSGSLSVSQPVLTVKNRDTLSFEQGQEIVELLISASDPRLPLQKFHIWINEVPLFGSSGSSLKKNKKLDTAVRVQLTEGMNVIESSVSNIQGGESYRYPLHLSYRPAEPVKEKLWFIGIGIDRFADKKHNLNYCTKDIRDLALKLKEKYKGEVEIDTLFDERVTVSEVTALRKKLLMTSIHDKVIISYSGHGLLSKNFDYYLSTYGVDFSNPEKGGLPYQALEYLLDSIPARKKLMLIDACHSGEVDKEEMERYAKVLAGGEKKNFKGGDVILIDSAHLGMKNSFELMQEVFLNVGRSTGATIISAAAATQLAQERGDLNNGVFTYSILEFMERHSTATVSELKNYVNKRVAELTNGLQVPTARTETTVSDWRLW